MFSAVLSGTIKLSPNLRHTRGALIRAIIVGIMVSVEPPGPAVMNRERPCQIGKLHCTGLDLHGRLALKIFNLGSCCSVFSRYEVPALIPTYCDS